ncbi:polysaccharide deacetylase family protein [Gorillibacterium sp. CAU 1737]|uniref:polysaccharide deacetylase family protein n=1 Tax=Gorillibacterium sp. CAU 1737 TaxID=3140362 RepID=UPI00326068EF
MKEKLIWGIAIFLAVYMLLPWILTRMLSVGVIRRGGKKQLALTFDDGPDPTYTPKLLDLLKEHGVQATFFVLGSKAEKHPDLIQRIHEEGHQIGIHNYTHFSNWLMSPWRVKNRHVDRSATIVEGITGVRPTYYRPPWGIINIFDFILKKNYKIVLWSLMTHDWNSSIGSAGLKMRLSQGVSDGAIILLHDSGDTLGADVDAPAYMLEALAEALTEFKEAGYSFARVDDLKSHTTTIGMAKRVFIRLWMVWERLFIRVFHIVPIDPDNTFLQIRVREYTDPKPLTLEDGEVFAKGDRILELHLNNDTLLELGRTSRNSTHLAIQMIRRTRELLPQITRLIENDPAYRDVKGLYGITLINRGPEQLGFTVFDLPSGPFAYFTKVYLRLLMYVIHPDGKDRLKTKSDLLVPKIIAISSKELENRYAA